MKFHQEISLELESPASTGGRAGKRRRGEPGAAASAHDPPCGDQFAPHAQGGLWRCNFAPGWCTKRSAHHRSQMEWDAQASHSQAPNTIKPHLALLRVVEGQGPETAGIDMGGGTGWATEEEEDKGGETNDHNTLESVISPLAAVAEVEASDKCGGTD